MIIVTTSADNIKSKRFNWMLEKLPDNTRVIHCSEGQDTVYHKVLGAVCSEDDAEECGLED